MEINAAVFRKVHEPLTIEAVDIDKPWGREVLVRTAATGVCHRICTSSTAMAGFRSTGRSSSGTRVQGWSRRSAPR